MSADRRPPNTGHAARHGLASILGLAAFLFGGCVAQALPVRTVVVVDDAGKPVAGAEVYAVGADCSAGAVTGPDGSAEIRVPDVPVSVVVSGMGYDPTQANVSTNRLIRVLLFRSRP